MNIKLMKRPTKIFTVLCILSVITAGCYPTPATIAPSDAPASAPTLAPTAATGAYWPTNGWRTSTPEEQGMDSQMLADMVAEIKERKMNVRSLLVIRNGYLVNETYFGSYVPDDRQDVHSVTKSFMSTLVGIALDKGYLAGTDQRVVDLFSDRPIKALDERKEAMTVEDLLTMRSGMDCTDPASWGTLIKSPDWVQFALDLPMVQSPGVQWAYCTGDSHLLSAIVQKTSGMNTLEFADEYLFTPLGISDFKWTLDPAGTPAGGAGLQIKPRDMAKLGHLDLRKGQWDGQQIVSPEWMEKATQTRADLDVNPRFEYGYHWFTHPAMAGYAALRDLGQIILVIPESDLIIVTTANTEESIFELFEQYVLPAVQKSE